MSGEYLRPAHERDIDFLFELANDPECRKNSFHSDPIPFSDHQRWFQNKLNSSGSIIYIYMSEDGQAMGQIRLDFKDNKATINYSIRKEFRGQGHGKKIIVLVEEELKRYKQINEVIAQVKLSNRASSLIFEKCGFVGTQIEDHTDYIKHI